MLNSKSINDIVAQCAWLDQPYMHKPVWLSALTQSGFDKSIKVAPIVPDARDHQGVVHLLQVPLIKNANFEVGVALAAREQAPITSSASERCRDHPTARRPYLEAKKMEPKYNDWDRDIEDLKLQMKIRGVAASPPH